MHHSNISALLDLEHTRYAMKYASYEAEWLNQTAFLPKAQAGANIALPKLKSIDVQALMGNDMKRALDEAHSAKELSANEASLVAFIEHERERLNAVDEKLLAKQAELANKGYALWYEAKTHNAFDSFAPFLEEAISLQKEIAYQIDPQKSAYDVCLDIFEPGSNVSFYDELFETINESVLPTVHAVLQKAQNQSSVLNATFAHDEQMEAAKRLLELEGVDFEALLLSEAEHPFTIGIDPGHVFVTTHIYEDSLLSNLYSAYHEGGHALYQQGIDQDLAFTSLCETSSMGMDESQSRFFENLVGRSWEHMPHLLDILHSIWPEELASLTPEELYQAVNAVKTHNTIRTEADELTYPFHVELRYVIERELFSGELQVKDVPARWNELAEKLLGVAPKNNAEGCLQDIHWSAAEFGYFPTYVLGSVIGAQLAGVMEREINFSALVEANNIETIKNWLKEKIWKWGRTKSTQELMQEVCGEAISAKQYCAYLRDKFSRLYAL